MRLLPIGLDIGTVTVRMLQVGGSERDLRVLEAAQYVIPHEVKADPVARRQSLIEGIRLLVREHRFRGREVVSALGSAELAIRNVRLPKMPDEELETAVNWEAQNKFPFDTATAIIQHLRAGEIRQGDQVLDEIILLAAPRAEVDSRIQLIREAGLDLVSLDARPAAIFRGFERFLRRREDETVLSAFADIGAGTTVVITRGREIVFIKVIPIGGTVLNRAVAECLELSLSEGEALRRRLGRRESRLPSDCGETDRVVHAVSDAIRPHLEDLANEIELCLRYHGVTFRGPRPESLVLTGGESHNADVVSALGERLGLKVQPADPLRGVRTDQLGPVLDRRGMLSEWTTAFGLSLKGQCLAGPLASGQAA